MPQEAVKNRNISVRLACQLLVVSKSRYRYQAKLSEYNEVIFDWLIHIADSQHKWVLDLCFWYLHNVKGFRFNHKRVLPGYTTTIR